MQGGLTLSLVASLALGVTQLDLARAEPRDVVVAGVPTNGPVPSGTAGCAVPYNDRTLAARSLAFDGTVTGVRDADDGHVRVDLDVHRWFKGGTSGKLSVSYLAPGSPDAPPAFGPGTRLLVSGEGDQTGPIAWACGFTRYWTEQDSAVWDRAFSLVLGSSAARSGLWCITDEKAVEANQEWRSTARAQEATRQAEKVLASRYGVDSKASPRTQLKAGIIGIAGDAARDQLVVVVDPTKISIAELEAALNTRRNESKRPAPVVVRLGCHTADDLVRAIELMERRDWHPDASKTSFGGSFDVYASRWDVTMPSGLAADSLSEQLGDLVLIREGTASRN